jgi:phosphoglycerate dehydrogenase-like enzyme
MPKPRALFILNEGSYSSIYGPKERAAIDELVDIYALPQTAASVKENPTLLKDIEIIFSGWGAPRIDAEFLAAAPNLKAVFYGAGSVKGLITDEFWERGVTLTSSWGANAIPVIEYTLAQVLFSLKYGWHYALTIKRDGKYPRKQTVPGAYGSTVAVISLGMIGRGVCEHLKRFDVDVIAYDPFADEKTAADLGVTLVSLAKAFALGDVVTLHTPWLKETENMIQGAHFRAMKEGATFINTARGAVVDEPAMIEALQERPDIFALLDVTYPEPPKPESPLYTMPNVILTPHIAGSMSNECRRMGQYAIDECRRYLNGEPLQWQVTKELAAKLA